MKIAAPLSIRVDLSQAGITHHQAPFVPDGTLDQVVDRVLAAGPELGAELALDEPAWPASAEMFRFFVDEILQDQSPAVAVLKAAQAFGLEPRAVLEEALRRLRAAEQLPHQADRGVS